MAASLRETLLLMEVLAARALARQPEPLAALVVYPGQPEPLVLPLLLADYSAKVVVVEAVAQQAQAVPGVLADAALVVAAVELVALHTLLALAV